MFGVAVAYAQAAGASPGPAAFLVQLAPFVLVIAVFYFLIIRPQQQRVKKHREMVSAVRRGDTVITSGGIIGKVTKVIDDEEIEVEIADGVKVRVVKTTLSHVRAKGEPVAVNDDGKSG